MDINETTRQLVDRVNALIKKSDLMAEQSIRQCAQIAALEAVIGAILRTHPDPDTIRQAVTQASAHFLPDNDTMAEQLASTMSQVLSQLSRNG